MSNRVIETKDSEIRRLNLDDEDEIGTGEVQVGNLSHHPTNELEKGKAFTPKPTVAGGRPKQDITVASTSISDGVIENPKVSRERVDLGDSTKLEVVQVKIYIKCHIGPKWYEFKPGQIYRVPANVKLILKRRGALGVL